MQDKYDEIKNGECDNAHAHRNKKRQEELARLQKDFTGKKEQLRILVDQYNLRDADPLGRSLVYLHSELTSRQNYSAAVTCSASLIHVYMSRIEHDSHYTTWPIIETQNVLPL